jgi:hypothetical protein
MTTSNLTIAVAVLAAASMIAAPLLLGEQAFASKENNKKAIDIIEMSRDNIATNENTQSAEASAACGNTAGLALVQANVCPVINTAVSGPQIGVIVDLSENNMVANRGNN